MPPTLVASIYGMNFKHMPELELARSAIRWRRSAAVFKWRKWLTSFRTRGRDACRAYGTRCTCFLASGGKYGAVRDRAGMTAESAFSAPHTCCPPLMWISAPFTYELDVSVHST